MKKLTGVAPLKCCMSFFFFWGGRGVVHFLGRKYWSEEKQHVMVFHARVSLSLLKIFSCYELCAVVLDMDLMLSCDQPCKIKLTVAAQKQS